MPRFIFNFVLLPQLADAPSAHRGKLGESSRAAAADEDIERQLAALKDL